MTGVRCEMLGEKNKSVFLEYILSVEQINRLFFFFKTKKRVLKLT